MELNNIQKQWQKKLMIPENTKKKKLKTESILTLKLLKYQLHSVFQIGTRSLMTLQQAIQSEGQPHKVL